MKTSEQMTKDVLKRRDEELKALPKKRRIKMAVIGTPCMAAAAALGIVTFNFVHGANEVLNTYEGITLGDYTYMFFHGGKEKYVNTVLATPGNAEADPELGIVLDGTIDIAYENQINRNPNAGKYVYKLSTMENVSDIIALEKPLPELDPNDFMPQTVKQLNTHYGIEFDRFTRLHPDWTESHEQFGLYIHDEYTSEYASRKFVSDRNTLNYVTPGGAEISVTAQSYQKFFDDKHAMAWDETDGNGLIGEVPKLDSPEYPEIHYIYDEDGNIIGAYTPGYNPGNTGVINDNKTDDHVVTIVLTSFNGVEYLTYLDMGNTWVRVYIKGISSYEEIKELLNEYTADLTDISGETANEPDIASVSNTEDVTLGNPNAGKYVYDIIELPDVKSVEDKEIPLPELDPIAFVPQTIEELNSYYGIEFDRFSKLYTDWTESHEPFGLYFLDKYESEVSSRAIINTRNTLNYTTPSGAKISVTAKQGRFIPVVTAGEIGAQRLSIGGGYIVDANGNLVEEIVPDYVPENNTTSGNDDDIVITIISNYEDTEFLAYVDMGITWVKIYAEGLSGIDEFNELVDEYIK